MSMESPKQILCRLCLNFINDIDFEVIEEIIRGILQVVLPSLDLETKDKHVMCRTCHVKLIAAFNFKSMCIDTEDVITSYINSEQMAIVELKDVYLMEKGNFQLIDMSGNQKICRLCMHLVTYGFESLNEVEVNIIANYIPEININAIKEPIICELCFDSLHTHDSFRKYCLNAQEKYVQFCNKAEDNNLSSNLDSEEFKLEKTYFDVCDMQSYIKTEETDIKAEESDQNSDSSVHNLIRNSEMRHVGYSREIVHEYISQCKAGQFQINRTKSAIQKSEDPFVAPELNNDLKNKNAHKLRKHETDECVYQSNCKQSFTKHQSVHKDTSEAQVYRCDKCNYYTKYRSNLIRHVVIHEARLYKCDDCDFQTKSKRSLTFHKKNHEDVSKAQKYKCGTCSYETKYRGNLKEHQLTHKDLTEIQLHRCDTCGYETKFKRNLKRHQLMHKDFSEVQMYKCDACSYESLYEEYLKRHQLIHKNLSEIQMYKCDACSYKSKRKECLKFHQLKHKDPSEVQMYKCAVCSYETVYRTTLKRHVLKHKDLSEIQMYKCDACDYETKRKDNLKGHCLIHRNTPKV